MRISIAIATAALLFTAQSAPAQELPGHIVRFAAPVKAGEFFVHDLFWTCAGRLCAAMLSNSRPVVVCMAMARALGPVTAFDTEGANLKNVELARCNAPRGVRHLTSAR